MVRRNSKEQQQQQQHESTDDEAHHHHHHHHHHHQQQHHQHQGSNYDQPGNSAVRQAIMAYYRTEQRLPIPRQHIANSTSLQPDMLITAKERSIASKSQLKGHAHHYFLSPYRNLQRQAGGGATDIASDEAMQIFDSTTSQLKHAESLMTLTTLSPRDADMTSSPHDSGGGGETSRSLPGVFVGGGDSTHAQQQIPTKDKLPAIATTQQQRRAQPPPATLLNARAQKDNSWLGPPNSVPPNKRSEHVYAYKTKAVCVPYSSSDRGDDCASTDVQSESETLPDKQPLLMDRFAAQALYRVYDDDVDVNDDDEDDDDRSSSSLYPSDDESDGQTFSIASDSRFAHLRLIDKPFGSHFSSAGTSMRMTSLDASHTQRSSTYHDVESSGRYSSRAHMLQYGESLSDSRSNVSVTSHATGTLPPRKRVQFDPQVRDVSRENRSVPLTANRTHAHDVTYQNTTATDLTSPASSAASVRVSLDTSSNAATAAADSAVEQLPAVVEKFTIKSLPVLPRIPQQQYQHHHHHHGVNLSNANIIYIKGGGGGANSSRNTTHAPNSQLTKPVFIAKHNVVDTSRSPRLAGRSPRQQQHAVTSPLTTAAAGSSQSGSSATAGGSGGSGGVRVYTQQRGTPHHHHHHHAVAAVPQLSRVAEESSSQPSSSPSPQQLKHATTAANNNSHQQPWSSQQVNKTNHTVPSWQQVSASHVTTTNHSTSQQYSSSTSNNTHSTAAAATTTSTKPTATTTNTTTTRKAAASKKVKPDATSGGTGKAKPASTTKSKGSKGARKGRSSDSSSRNSPSVDSPTNVGAAGAGDVTLDEAELREQRQREYAAAMLAVQQRMREFDMRYGRQGDDDIERSTWFGKVIPPTKGTAGQSNSNSSHTVTSHRANKPAKK